MRLAAMDPDLHEPANIIPEQTTKRAPIACKRCRRLRIKCVQENTVPPCMGCHNSSSIAAAACVFPQRGSKDEDREVSPESLRETETKANCEVSEIESQSRARPETPTRADITPPAFRGSHSVASPGVPVINDRQKRSGQWILLPPYEEVVQGCKVLSSSYFQLGFIPKAVFLERLARDSESVSVFLLLSILSVSARFTPSLIARYGGGSRATEYFIAKATDMVPLEIYKPSLDHTQAFFLLAIADWGNGNKNRSSMHMGFAVTMSGILGLHREGTYQLPEDATADQVVDSEMARRTFWMIESQSNLHSGNSTPLPFALSDITAKLPCEESDFAFGVVPRERAVLSGTQAAVGRPDLVSTPSRSLFASLVQSHNLWGQVARRACRTEREFEGTTPKPWESHSEYNQLSNALHKWEKNLPARHQWSIRNLRGYKAESLDLAYLAIVMVLRLSNIVLRRIYLPDMVAATSDSSGNINSTSLAPPRFWENMSEELFRNVQGLHQQIDAYLPLRSREEGFPPIIIFCVYICGSLAAHLCKTPQLCIQLSRFARSIFQSCLGALTDFQHTWPMALRWQEALQKFAIPVEDSTSQPHHEMSAQLNVPVGDPRLAEMSITEMQSSFRQRQIPQSMGSNSGNVLQNLIDSQGLEECIARENGVVEVNQDASTSLLSSVTNANDLPIDIFEAELTAFLQGEVPIEAWSNWEWH